MTVDLVAIVGRINVRAVGSGHLNDPAERVVIGRRPQAGWGRSGAGIGGAVRVGDLRDSAERVELRVRDCPGGAFTRRAAPRSCRVRRKNRFAGQDVVIERVMVADVVITRFASS